MSIVKHISSILTEQISDNKREALLKLFFKKNKGFFDWYKKQFTMDYGDYSILRMTNIFDLILSIDPTPNNQYTQWLILKGIPSKYVADNSLILSHRIEEDKDEIKNLLSLHFEKKQSKDFPQEYKDINKINSIQELRKSVDKYIVTVDSSFDDILKDAKLTEQDYSVFYEDDVNIIYIPKTEKGACVLGAKTEWCTAWGKHSVNPSYKGRHNMFSTYEGRLYIIRIKTNTDEDEFFQIHFESQQFMNKADNNVGFGTVLEQITSGAKKAVASLLFDEINEYKSGSNKRKIKNKGYGNYTLWFDSFESFAKTFIDAPYGLNRQNIMDIYETDWLNDFYFDSYFHELNQNNKKELIEYINKKYNEDYNDKSVKELEKVIMEDLELREIIHKSYLETVADLYLEKKMHELNIKLIQQYDLKLTDIKNNKNSDGSIELKIDTNNIFELHNIYVIYFEQDSEDSDYWESYESFSSVGFNYFDGEKINKYFYEFFYN
jgi:hypothetical protein